MKLTARIRHAAGSVRMLAVSLALLTAAASAHAALVPVSADGAWHAFDVDDLSSISGGLEWITLSGDALVFRVNLSSAARLTIVDGGFGGDRFSVIIDGASGVQTSAVPDSFPASYGTNFDFALNDSSWSRLIVDLAPGVHDITGLLSRSALVQGLPINATVGAISIAQIPLPPVMLLFLTALGAMAAGRSSKRSPMGGPR